MADRFDRLIAFCERNGIEVSQNFTVRFVGSKDRLKYLIDNGHVRARKTGKAQNAKKRCWLADVLKYAKL